MASSRVVLAGAGAALVGFTSSSAVVLAGLRAAGATPEQAASGLVAVCLTQAVGMIWLAQRTRMPLMLAWSTPGATLLAAGQVPTGGWPAVVGAFLLTGVLILVAGLWPRFAAVVRAIPASVAQAMLAGVLLALCLAPVRGLLAEPAQVAPVIAVWLLLFRFARRWAVPAAFAAGLVVLGLVAATSRGISGPLVPVLEPVAPVLDPGAVAGIAIPLFLVTMASQNVPGTAILASYGYETPWRHAMTVTGVATLAGAPFGGHVVNLAAITAALGASPEAHPDPAQRWRVVRSAGVAYLLLAVVATALSTLTTAAPEVLTAVAGVALLPTLGSALRGALASTSRGEPEAAVVTFVVAASGVVVLGVGAAFWALIAGLFVLLLLRLGSSRRPAGEAE